MARSSSTKPPTSKGGTFTPPRYKNQVRKRHDDYTSDGVEDNDIFLLPISDYQIMVVLTILGALVRLFRIYQPTSVVFDEVQ